MEILWKQELRPKKKASSRATQLPVADRTRTRPSDPHAVLSVSTAPSTHFRV